MQMATVIFGVICIVIGFLISLLRTGNKQSKAAAQVIDLTQRINANKQALQLETKSADDAVKEYTDALKVYDSSFHDDGDDGTGGGQA